MIFKVFRNLAAAFFCLAAQGTVAKGSVDESLLGGLCALETVRLRQVAESSEAVLCGLGAVSCVVEAARALGARWGRLVASGGSEEAGGDPGSRTGYAAVVVA